MRLFRHARTLRVLTLNAGLLSLQLCGQEVRSVPHHETRLEYVARALEQADADIVALQEVFAPEHRDSLTRRLEPVYPHAARSDDRRGSRLGNGLLILSRHPLRDSRFHPFDARMPLEGVAIDRGVLEATADVPELGAVRVLAFHAAAGALQDAQAPRTEAVRDGQIRQLHRIASDEADDPITLLAGDLNAGPQASPENFSTLLRLGYIDPFGPDDAAVTWRPDNPLNHDYPDAPPQRIDHVLLAAEDTARIAVERAAVVFTERVVPAADGATPISDHCGVLVTLGPARRTP